MMKEGRAEMYSHVLFYCVKYVLAKLQRKDDMIAEQLHRMHLEN